MKLSSVECSWTLGICPHQFKCIRVYEHPFSQWKIDSPIFFQPQGDYHISPFSSGTNQKGTEGGLAEGGAMNLARIITGLMWQRYGDNNDQESIDGISNRWQWGDDDARLKDSDVWSAHHDDANTNTNTNTNMWRCKIERYRCVIRASSWCIFAMKVREAWIGWSMMLADLISDANLWGKMDSS